jgi:predicted Zn-dependent protease
MSPSCSEAAGRLRRGLAGLLVLALVPGCATPLTIPEERELGEEFAREIKREVVFVGDEVVHDYVERIGREMIQAAGPQPLEYHFYVIEDENINAFAGPGGYIYVHTETVLRARNVSELAGVVAHEVGHVVERHVAENYNRQRSTGLLYQLGVILAGLFGGQVGAGLANIGGGLAATAYINSFGREAEMEADAFAVGVMARAGYDPSGLVSFFQVLQAEGGSGVPSFLSSHPATEDRIAATSALIERQGSRSGLRREDGGKLQIIQRRIRLLTGPPPGRR